jgi:hypothetical protein
MPIVGLSSEHVPHIFSVLYHTILNYQKTPLLGDIGEHEFPRHSHRMRFVTIH